MKANLFRLVTVMAGVLMVSTGSSEYSMGPHHHWPWVLLDFAGGMACSLAAFVHRSAR